MHRLSPPSLDIQNLTKFRFEPGKTHRLRLISAGASACSDSASTTSHSRSSLMISPPCNRTRPMSCPSRWVSGSMFLLTIPEDHVEPLWIRSYISDLCSFMNHYSAHAVAYFTRRHQGPGAQRHGPYYRRQRMWRRMYSLSVCLFQNEYGVGSAEPRRPSK
jgi:hypothetical protein